MPESRASLRLSEWGTLLEYLAVLALVALVALVVLGAPAPLQPTLLESLPGTELVGGFGR